MTLLWDGSFHGNEYKTSTSHVNDPSGGYSVACLAYTWSFEVVPAPGGRNGYAGRFEQRPGGSCGSTTGSEHTVIESADKVISNGGEYWIGWSEYLDSSYSPSGTWQHLGVATANTGIANGNLYLNARSTYLGRELYVNQQSFGDVLSSMSVSLWYDFIYHVKFKTDNTGILEFYARQPGETGYRELYSNSNVNTFPVGGASPVNIRVGSYRGYQANTTQIIYIYNPKVGTTMADVAYNGGTVTCPSASITMNI